MTDTELVAFYSGIRTALALIDAHGEDTLYDELVNMCDADELIKYAKRDGEYKFAGLHKWKKRTKKA